MSVQPPVKDRDVSKRASYIPRNAARQFAATTTPMPSQASKDAMKRAKSTKERSKPVFTADSKPCMNPKALKAALNQGMSESEAATAATAEAPKIRSASAEKQCRDAKPRSHSPPESTSDDLQRSASMRGYRPGDADKRNGGKRSSQIVSGTLVAVTHGSTATYQQREYALDLKPLAGLDVAPKLDAHLDSSAIAEEGDDGVHHSHHVDPRRPGLRPHDRVNWAQESQCGDEMRHHLHWRRRKSTQTTTDREDAHAALVGDVQQKPRQKSLGDIHENLISDAVRLIKKEEKVKRRRSIVDFFKRL